MIKGKSLITDFFIIKILKKNDQKFLKISALSPKKTFPTAVMRNKARRRVYSAISKTPKPNANNFLVAIIGSKKVLTEKIETISAAIEQSFKKGGIL